MNKENNRKNVRGGGTRFLNNALNKKRKLLTVTVILIVAVFIVFLNNSYAYLEKSVDGGCVNLEVGKLIHSLNSDVILDKGESRIIDLIVKNNENTLSKYQIYYASDDDLTDVVVGYSSDSIDLPSGEIEAGGRKRVSIILVNNSSNVASIELGVKGGLNQNTIEDIILEEKEFRIENVINKDIEQIKSPSELYAFYKGSFSATATTNDVLTGKTVYINGQEAIGTMPNNGAVSKTITPTTSAQTYTIPAGYHDGSGKVTVSAATTLNDTVLSSYLAGMNSNFSSANPVTYTNTPNYKYVKYSYNGNIGCKITGGGKTLTTIAGKSGGWEAKSGTISINGIASVSINVTATGFTDGSITLTFTNTP